LINIDLAKAKSAVEETVGFLADTLGEEAGNAGMHPDLAEKEIIDNPYHYNK
jgi:hypothetical protein